MPEFIRSTLLLLLVCLTTVTAHSQDISTEELRSLDEQVQEIKSDVLGIAAELDNLEERLLYPSNTEVAVFIAMEDGQKFRLDAVKVEIDGELASHHIYSFKELDALQRGGVQRVYTGNLATGGHNVSIHMLGKRENGDDFEATNTASFSKGIEPKILGVTLASTSGDGIQIGEW